MALAAFAVRSGEETRQMQVVCLDDLVPPDDDLRRIEALVDWGPDADAQTRPGLALAEPRTGPTPRRTASNATAVSRTDPDAKLRHKPRSGRSR